ncbi:hypothetical protein L7F22_013155 [Adiantum nelumboides]|nr:hypothetical protein [Adiantum nelumboides]
MFEKGSSSHGTEKVSQDEDALFRAQLISFLKTFSSWAKNPKMQEFLQALTQTPRAPTQGLQTPRQSMADLLQKRKTSHELMNRGFMRLDGKPMWLSNHEFLFVLCNLLYMDMNPYSMVKIAMNRREDNSSQMQPVQGRYGGRSRVRCWKGDFSGWGGVSCGLRSSGSDLFSQHWCSSLSARSLATLKGKTNRRKRDLARREFQLLRRKTKLLKATLSPEERLLWRLRKANRKKYILLQRLKKYELEEDPEPVHDPELITAEQLQALKKIGYKNRNYVPVGRRGVYGGVVLNMHMHWKFHETVQVDCHIFKREDVRSVARQLAILSGGIVIDIHQATTIIMYRGRNYRQPKKQMTPPNTLTRRKVFVIISCLLNFVREISSSVMQNCTFNSAHRLYVHLYAYKH